MFTRDMNMNQRLSFLEKILSDYSDIEVGKLILELLEYKKSHIGVGDDEKETFIKCVDIANNLIGKMVKSKSCKRKQRGRKTVVQL